MYSFSGNSTASAPISTFMCLSDLYSPRSGLHISSSRIGRPIVGIYKSLTEWMWKLGLRPRYSFSGNICFEISVFCLCSGDLDLHRYSNKKHNACSWCLQAAEQQVQGPLCGKETEQQAISRRIKGIWGLKVRFHEIFSTLGHMLTIFCEGGDVQQRLWQQGMDWHQAEAPCTRLLQQGEVRTVLRYSQYF